MNSSLHLKARKVNKRFRIFAGMGEVTLAIFENLMRNNARHINNGAQRHQRKGVGVCKVSLAFIIGRLTSSKGQTVNRAQFSSIFIAHFVLG